MTEDEYKTIKDHAFYTSLILREIDGLQEIAYWASSHHEKHDNSGYPMQISGTDFILPIDVLAFADIFAALAEERPYRVNKSKAEIKEILKTFIPDKLDANIYKVLIEHFDELYTLQEKVRSNL